MDAKGKIISLINPGDSIKEICAIGINHYNNYSYIIANSTQEAINWGDNAGINVDRNKIKRTLYLPLEEIGLPPFPNNNQEIVERLRTTSSQILKAYYGFLNKNERPSLIVFGINNNNERLLGAWQHKKYNQSVYNGKINKTINHQKGFRTGHQNSYVELTGFAKNLEIDKLNVHRYDKERLFNRGGNGLNIDQEYNINLVGCGSIGSFLLDNLVKLGFNNFNLVDKELLSPENIARHYCGAKYVGTEKTDALKKCLGEKYPHLNIDIDNRDFQQVLIQEPNYLNSFNLNIICVAEPPLERMINELYCHNKGTSDLLFVWVEPFLNAGQAILLKPNSYGCFCCLFEQESWKFKYRINKSNRTFKKKESGCQSSYLPYGASDIQSFANFLAKIIDKIHVEEYNENKLFQWIKNDDNLGYSYNISSFEDLANFELCKLCKGS